MLKQKLLALRAQIKKELQVYQLVMADARTPRLAKWLLGAAIVYFISPVDLVPDAIPVLGQLDDLLIVPGLFWLALKMIPAAVVSEARQAIARNEGQIQG